MLRILVILTEPRRANENHQGDLMVQSTRKLVAEGHELVERYLCVGAFCDIQGWGSDGKRVECQGTREGELLSDVGPGPLSPRANRVFCYCYPLRMEGAKLI